MKNIPARRCTPSHAPKATITDIWYVCADETYRVSLGGTWTQKAAVNQYIAIRTLSGSGNLHLQGHSLAAKPDSIGIFSAEQPFSYSADSCGWEFYWFDFTIDSDSLLTPGLTTLHLSAQEKGDLEHCFASFGSGSITQCYLADSLFNCLLARWSVHAAGQSCRERILLLLEQGRRQQLCIPEIARMAGMSERSFRDAVHRVVGMSPSEYILKCEMSAAMDLLRSTDMSISRIASCFQYSSPLYFSRVFKKYYGLSPQHVRRQFPL